MIIDAQRSHHLRYFDDRMCIRFYKTHCDCGLDSQDVKTHSFDLRSDLHCWVEAYVIDARSNDMRNGSGFGELFLGFVL